LHSISIFIIRHTPHRYTLFPYTTLFRSNKNISELIKDRVVLVTGGGGSIGSELCRQIMKHNPKKLIIFDIYENNLYNIELELKRSEEHTSELQSRFDLVCRLLLEKKKKY